MKTTKSKTNAGCALYDNRKKDFVAVGGQILHDSPTAIRDYLGSGSDWVEVDQMEIVHFKLFTDLLIRVPDEIPELKPADLPSDL